jgi:hydrogenase-4 component E
MIPFSSQILFFMETLMFLSVVSMHLTRRNSSLIFLYTAQSLIISVALFRSSLHELSLMLMLVALITFAVKAILAPWFFFGLIRKHQLQFSVSTQLNAPMTLIVLAALTAFSFSHLFQPLAVLAPDNEKTLLLAMAMMFVSIFLIINRKGALSQMTGILSLENSIVSFAYVAGLESTAGPKIGILFDILVWVIIATVFASMIYTHFGSLDVSEMNQLREE